MPAVGPLLFLVAAGAAAQQVPLVQTTGWRHLFEDGPIDPGIGVLSFETPTGPRWSDSLALYRQPGHTRPIGHFLFASDEQGGWSYAVAWPTELTTNLLEFGYEVAGLPFDSLTPDEQWARVIPGFGRGNAPERAWARLAPGDVTVTKWAEELTRHELFVRQGVTPAFFETPGGPPVAFPLPPDGRDYILHPLEARGDWLRVRAVSPSDYCADPESPRVAEVWIRYLDPTGRPLVWYHTRGC